MKIKATSILLITLFLSIETPAQWIQKNPILGKPVAYSLLNMHNVWVADQTGIITHLDLQTHKVDVRGNLKTGILRITFVDSLNGFVISASHKIFATSDGGKTWVQKNLSGEYFLFQSKDTWFKTGSITPSTYDILRTTDEGFNWDTITSPYTGEGAFAPTIYGAKFINANFGLVGIASASMYGHITIALFGLNFFNLTSTLIKSANTPGLIFDIFDKNCWAFTLNNLLYVTENGGSTYKSNSLPSLGTQSIEMLDHQIFFAVSANGLIASIQKTTDQGITWHTISNLNFLKGNTPELKMFDELNGVLVDRDHGNNIYSTTDGGYTWNVVVDFSVQVTEDILAVYFKNENDGLAVTKNGLTIKTDDKGNTWSVAYKNSLLPLSQVQIFDADTIYAYSRYNNNDIHFYYTFNGGKLWNETIVTLSPDFSPYQNMFFWDKLHGWLTGKENKVLFTEDGGKSWKEFNVSSRFFSSFFVDTLNGYFTTYDGLYRTTDGAKSMQLIYNAPQLINFVYFANKDSGWVFVGGLGVGRTTDGGKTFKMIKITNDPSWYSWVSAKFSDSNNGYALQSFNQISATNDGGKTWHTEKILNDPSLTLNGFFALSNKNVWVVGNKGIIYNGQINFTSDTTHSDTTHTDTTHTDTTKTDTSKVLPKTYALFQNYPNPFNPSTVIGYQLPVDAEVSLKVYDTLGRLVAVLVDEKKTAGSYEVKFSGNGLSSGVYFYRIQAGNFSQTKKFVLMK